MTSTARVLQAHAAAGLATALLLLAAYTLFALVQAGPASWIAGRALPLPASGLSLPVGPLLWWLPAAILAQHWLLVASLPGAAIRRTLTLLGAVLLAGLWLLLLARHDRTLSAWQATLLLAIAVGCARTWRHGLLLALAYAGLAALTWGAIWGEQRCDESGPVGCLVSSGLRVQVPQALAAAGLPAFAQLAGQDLRGAKLSGRDLRYADLRGADLRGADLRGADFSGSNLRRARLAGADARGARFDGSDLTGAELQSADLGSTDLHRLRAYAADLRGANLTAARLDGASLSHAALAGARFDGARLAGSYLRFVSGLTEGQFDGACGDASTLAPPGLKLRDCAALP